MSAPLQLRHAQISRFMSLATPEISLRKAQLRARMKNYRANLGATKRARASQTVCEILNNWLRNRAEMRIALYLATPLELDLDALAAELIARNMIVCAPRLNAATATMNFVRLLDLSALERGAFGVRAPISGEIVRPEIVLAPGLAFDKSGARLGMGGGWYDRVLPDVAVKVGICFGGQIVNEVPTKSHDIPMNWLASEAGLMRCEM